MAQYRSFRDLDWSLLAISLVLCAVGVLQIYSATHDTKWQDAWWKQIIWIVIALGLMWVVMAVDYHTLLGQIPLLYAVVDHGVDRGFGGGAAGVRLAPLDPDPGI